MLASLQLKSTLVILELPNNHLGNLGAKALAQLSSLERLNLSDNRIEATGAAFIGKITTLRCLNLARNDIEDEGCGHLSSLSSLTSLDISSNEVTSVGLHCLTSLAPILLELVIDRNRIYGDDDTALTDLSGMTCLTSLSWSDPRLAGGSEFINTQQLSRLTQLRKLGLCGYELFQLGDSPALAGLAALTQLTSLNLKGLDLDGHPAEMRCLSSLASLMELTFSFSTSDEMLEPLTRLTKLTKLEVLYIGYWFCDNAAVQLTPLTNLRHLKLEYLDLEDEAAAAHLSSLRQNLTFLDISMFDWDEDNYPLVGVAAVRELGNLSNLLHLNVDGRPMSAAAAAELTRLTALTRLELEDNLLGLDGAEHVASLPRLEHLNIAHNELSAAGAAHVARLTSLTFLTMYRNQIGDAGAAVLATLPNLVALDVLDCGLGDGGAAALAQLSKLTYLEASYNNIGPVGVDQLSALTKLQHLSIIGGKASYRDVACLAMSLPQLRKLQYFGGYNPDNAKAATLLKRIVMDVC